jgi:transcriptional regulator with XRE-family HTH domain
MQNPTELPAFDSLADSMSGVRLIPRPGQGWLRAVREALGLSRRIIAEQLRVSPAAVRDYEAAEASDTITLRTLRRTAAALGCEVVIALVPTENRSFAELAATRNGNVKRRRPFRAPSVIRVPEDTGDLESHLK